MPPDVLVWLRGGTGGGCSGGGGLFGGSSGATSFPALPVSSASGKASESLSPTSVASLSPASASETGGTSACSAPSISTSCLLSLTLFEPSVEGGAAVSVPDGDCSSVGAAYSSARCTNSTFGRIVAEGAAISSLNSSLSSFTTTRISHTRGIRQKATYSAGTDGLPLQ